MNKNTILKNSGLEIILLLPYGFFTHPIIQLVLISVGLLGGRIEYFLISLAVFSIHIISNKLMQYKTNRLLENKSIPRIPMIQRVALSFVLGFFILVYLKGNNFDSVLIDFLGQLALPLLLIIIFSGIFSFLNLKKYEEKVLPILVVLVLVLLYFLIQESLFIRETYDFLIQYLFGIPSLYIAKALFFGLNWNEAHACFWKGSYEKEIVLPKKRSDNVSQSHS